MPIQVELYGIPRHRAGVAGVEVEADLLGDVFAELGRLLPKLNDVCLDGNRLRGGFLANINGRAFVTDPATPLHAGDVVLVLSSDVGG